MPARRGSDALVVGVLSDTHGLLRDEALRALAGVAHVLHAGDVGDARVLEQLAELAPVTAVRGNNDLRAPLSKLPLVARETLGGVAMLVVHELADLPASHGARVVVSGHSHRPSVEEKEGVLFLNPGSAGSRRFRLPVTVARIHLEKGRIRAELVSLVDS